MREVANTRKRFIPAIQQCLRKPGTQESFSDYKSFPAFLRSLEIFVGPRRDTIERFLDVLDRVGDAEAQIAFAESAERGTGQGGHAHVAGERAGGFFRVPAGLRDVGKNVECAFR